MGERQRENEERRQGLRLGMSKIYNIFRFKLNPCGVLGGISFSMSRSVRSSALHSLGQSHKTFPFFFFLPLSLPSLFLNFTIREDSLISPQEPRATPGRTHPRRARLPQPSLSNFSHACGCGCV